MVANPRNYPDTLISAESGRPMTRGEKPTAITIAGKTFHYNQPGWWCSLTDADDREGQLVDGDNQIRDMARRTAAALAAGEPLFVPIVIRAIRERCGLSQREAGRVFGGGAKSFEKYESGSIRPSGPTRRLLEIAMDNPKIFAGPPTNVGVPTREDGIMHVLAATGLDGIYAPLFQGSDQASATTEETGKRRPNPAGTALRPRRSKSAA